MIKNTNANFEYTEMVYGVVSKREMLCHNVYEVKNVIEQVIKNVR